MKKIRAAIVGYGNIGKYALQALEADERYAGKTQRLHEIADFIMARDH